MLSKGLMKIPKSHQKYGSTEYIIVPNDQSDSRLNSIEYPLFWIYLVNSVATMCNYHEESAFNIEERRKRNIPLFTFPLSEICYSNI